MSSEIKSQDQEEMTTSESDEVHQLEKSEEEMLGDGVSSSPDEVTCHNVKIVKVVPLPHARSEVWSYFGFIADDEGEIQDKKRAICKICATSLSYSGNTTNLFTHLKSMHPEANPTKLAPTNKNPKTGKKCNKRKFFQTLNASPATAISLSSMADVLQSAQATLSSNSPNTPLIIRAVVNNGQDVINIHNDSKQHVVTGLSPSPVPNNTPSDDYDDSRVSNNTLSHDMITKSIVDMLVTDCRPVSLTQGKGFLSMIHLFSPEYLMPDERRLSALVKIRYDELRRELILKGIE